MKNKMNEKIYVADFETSWNATLTKTWVWAACVMDIDTLNYNIQGNIEDFFEYISNLGSRHDKIVIYFHNLKFDGCFIMDYILRNTGLKRNDGAIMSCKVKLKKDEFAEMIDGFGRWYRVRFNVNGRAIELRDSLKLLPMSVGEIAKAMKMDELKGEIDYNLYRPLPWNITEEEEDYIRRDCKIVAKALKELFVNNGHNGLTIGSCCMKEYKSLFKAFDMVFPQLTEEEDEFVRRSYRGGVCWKGDFDEYDGNIVIADKNSMYPSMMHSCSGNLFPKGIGKKIFGDPREKLEGRYKLYVTHITATVQVKDNCLPFLQIETTRNAKNFVEAGDIDVVLTQPDFELLLENYHVFDIEFLEGYIYQAAHRPFDCYIDKWFAVKEEATVTNNYGLRLLAKLFLNNLYGKLATNPEGSASMLVIDDKDKINSESFTTHKDSVYIPAGSFITAYARCDLIRTAMKCGGRAKVLYMDTDSVHFIGTEMPRNVSVHDSKINCWAVEGKATKGIYIRQKTYAERVKNTEIERDNWDVKACGCPKMAKRNIKDVEEEFKIGMEVEGRLVPRKITGGVVLVDCGFKIKE